ncbi:MAG: hypothetical protein R3346_04325 [Candidatus Spechtbacterales bacterium]|nr:hypothetical protein [Candidatus Spechtbacterales bacterium]
MGKMFDKWPLVLLMLLAASLFGILLAWSFPQYNPLPTATNEDAIEDQMEEMEEDFENLDMEDTDAELDDLEEDLDALDESI